MTKQIEVNVRLSEYRDNWDLTPAMHECWIVGKLRDAGVPVDGKLVFNGIKSGKITRLDDPADFGVTKYVWRS